MTVKTFFERIKSLEDNQNLVFEIQHIQTLWEGVEIIRNNFFEILKIGKIQHKISFICFFMGQTDEKNRSSAFKTFSLPNCQHNRLAFFLNKTAKK